MRETALMPRAEQIFDHYAAACAGLEGRARAPFGGPHVSDWVVRSSRGSLFEPKPAEVVRAFPAPLTG